MINIQTIDGVPLELIKDIHEHPDCPVEFIDHLRRLLDAQAVERHALNFDTALISAGPGGVTKAERLQATCDGLDSQNDALAEEITALQATITQLEQRIAELTTDRDTLREALNALQPQTKVLKECAEGWGHGGFWCGPSYKCWLDPRPKDERD